MSKIELTENQITIFKDCLNAVVNGPFIPDWEFHILFGLHRSEVASVLEKWPRVENNETTILALNNSLANLTGYPISNEERWYEYINISREALSQFFQEWRGKEDQI